MALGTDNLEATGHLAPAPHHEAELHGAHEADRTFAAPVALECVGLSKKYGQVTAVDHLDLVVHQGQVVALLGPSGCGKTTVLRLIAGFDHPDSGSIALGDRAVFSGGQSAPPEKRRVGMVFQEGALFPHLTVEQNIAYGLPGGDSRSLRISEVLELVGLKELGKRMPHELSGGQQQRVALARALAPKPDLLLLDEPFSNLDPALRGQVREDVLRILQESGITAIFVTHDQEEALFVGDTIVVMSQGRIEQVGSPEAVFHSPSSRFVAEFIGTADFIPAHLDGARLVSEVGSVAWDGDQPGEISGLRSLDGSQPASDLAVMVRPDCLDCYPSSEGRGIITGREFRGAFYLYRVALPSGHSVRCLLSHTREYPVGASVAVTLREGHTLKPFWGNQSIDG